MRYVYKSNSYLWQKFNTLYTNCDFFSIGLFTNWTCVILIFSQYHIHNDNIICLQSTLFINILVTICYHYAINIKMYVHDYFNKSNSYLWQKFNTLYTNCDLFSIRLFTNWTCFILIFPQYHIHNDNIICLQSTLFINILVTICYHYAITLKMHVHDYFISIETFIIWFWCCFEGRCQQKACHK